MNYKYSEITDIQVTLIFKGFEVSLTTNVVANKYRLYC